MERDSTLPVTGTEMIYAGIVEYAAILAAISGNTFASISSFTSLEPTWTLILVIGGFIFFFWLFVFKL